MNTSMNLQRISVDRLKPEPAAALRSRFSPRASMALSCSSVHLGAFAISLPRFRLSLKPMIPHFPALDKPRPGAHNGGTKQKRGAI